MKIVAAKKILKFNDRLAAENRAAFDAAGAFCVNVVGSPGSGKTTLLEALFAAGKGRLRPAVIEGDIAGAVDAQRMENIDVPVVQINTEGACHLDAAMVASAVGELDLGATGFLMIENVGNLVCTAGFDLGEHLRLIVLSTSEGDDKVVKYPAIFQGSHALVITKSDLCPYLNFDPQRLIDDFHRLVPQAPAFQVAALRGDGVQDLAEWLLEKQTGRQGAALPEKK
ncbi:MAG: hydrogenase nickel incorporation protein HypB [Pirellulales bacterium]|nr:hydrogenase nickel incorporation protein HypB [Pirellulales bacterium]